VEGQKRKGTAVMGRAKEVSCRREKKGGEGEKVQGVWGKGKDCLEESI